MPPYFAQKHNNACSLVVLRSVLAMKGIGVSEEELIEKVAEDYGKDFKNIWNPTIAKLALQYGVPTKMYARWPLLKGDLIKQANLEYSLSPEEFNVSKYENPEDGDILPEPLPLAYKELFKAVDIGCEVFYGGLTKGRMNKLLASGKVIQTSIRTQKLYKSAKPSYHSLLIYDIDGDEVIYHDPARGAAMRCTADELIRAANGTGAFMAYSCAT
jgi:hypothetical protein